MPSGSTGSLMTSLVQFFGIDMLVTFQCGRFGFLSVLPMFFTLKSLPYVPRSRVSVLAFIASVSPAVLPTPVGR